MPTQIELTLTGMAHGGEALGAWGDRVVFVAYALPGETVRVELVEEHPRWARGRLIEVIAPSAQRVAASCPHFGPDRCGGCQWQHIARPAQLDFKARIVRDPLQRLGGLGKPQVRPTRSAGPDWAYRTQSLFFPANAHTLGLRKPQSYDVHAIDHCPLLHPLLAELYTEFNLAWDGLRSVDLSVGVSSGQRMVTLRTRRDQAPEIESDVPVAINLQRADDQVTPLIGEPWYFETLAGHEYRFSAGTWRPANPFAAELLLHTAAAYLRPQPGQTIMDVYCGSGLFTLHFAGRGSLLIGVEEDAIAIEDCAFNCSHLDNVALHEGPPAKVLRKLNDPIDGAILTPPAAGLGHRLAQNLARLGARRVVYVAHNPATLARDVAAMAAGGYLFQEATPVDVAPQTAYVTALALFTR